MEASYPDSGLVIDSKEGGSEESEEVENGAGEGGQDSCFSVLVFSVRFMFCVCFSVSVF